MNEYPARFLDLLADTDGMVLDCGSGGRKHPRVISLEPVEHPNNTLRADGLKLPFRDDSFALVLSQAVLEHVSDPQLYVKEIVRVLEPGGLLYIEAAFMQPVHQAPEHYFNCTAFGLAHLCRELDVRERGAFGTLAETWDWIGRDVDAPAVLGASRVRWVRTEMERLDAAMTPEQKWNTAPAVCLLGAKR